MTAFLIPSHVWYGLQPLAEHARPSLGTPDLMVGGWGGMLRDDDDVSGALAMLDPALLLLNLAGYQVTEVAIGIAASARATAAAELIAVDTRTMLYTKGTGHPFSPPATTPPSACVALWLEPRYPAARPAVGAGPTLSLGALGALGDGSIAIDAASSGTGWLRQSWPAGAALPTWQEELGLTAGTLAGALVDELDAQHLAASASAPNGDEPPLCGLLSLYDSRTWAQPLPDDPELDELTPMVGQFGEDLAAILDGGAESEAIGLGDFLRAEILRPPDGPPTALDRWSLAAGADVRATVEELSLCTDELVDRCFDVVADDEVTADFAVSAYGDLDRLPVTSLLLRWQELGVLDFLGAIEDSVDDLFAGDVYGGYDLRIDDDDATLVYGGEPRSAADGDAVPHSFEVGYVAQLRRDLAELGFGPLVGYEADENPSQPFEEWLERAVREFQLYAKMPNLARETTDLGTFMFYGERLEQVANPRPYTGPVSGVANAETRALLQEWRPQRLRCPVVIEARVKDAAKKFTLPFLMPGVTTDNIWRAQQVASAVPRMFARDFTGYWTLSADSVAANRDLGNLTIGAWTVSDFGPGPWSDPPAHTWAESEILPRPLTGREWAALGAEGRSTFRIVRTVAEVECVGYFDCFNAYDPGFISAGPFHWTLGLVTKGGTADAELPPYLAYLDGLGGDARTAYEAVFGFFGCGVTKRWPAGTSGETSPCFQRAHRKYAAWITFEDDDGLPLEANRNLDVGAEWFRQWHWFFRFSMASRTNETFRQRMWDYARLRVRDLLATPWFPAMQTDGRPATVGDLFTSERVVAAMLRWHVNRPADLLPLDPAARPRGSAPSRLVSAFQNAGAAGWGDPAGWSDANEKALGDALIALSAGSSAWLRQSLGQVFGWPTWLGANGRAWALNVAEVLPAPVLAGLANAATPVGTPRAIPFTIDWRGAPAGVLNATSGDQTVVPNAGIAIVQGAPNCTITLAPVAGKTGRATITLVADGVDGRTEATFTLTAGAVAGQAPAPTTKVGLSLRRHSFRLDESDPL